jgi:hypothetical protein
MPDPAESLARTMISAYGDGAIGMAEQAVENLRSHRKPGRADLWLKVITIIKAKRARQ